MDSEEQLGWGWQLQQKTNWHLYKTTVYQTRRKHDHCPQLVKEENKNVYEILTAESTLISVNDHEVLSRKGRKGEEKEFQ
jgi:hypothetical protein